jgi:hypothetical protein
MVAEAVDAVEAAVAAVEFGLVRWGNVQAGILGAGRKGRVPMIEVVVVEGLWRGSEWRRQFCFGAGWGLDWLGRGSR